jgi:16S rRNA (cytidine1402-2'-O)-methyltransferase
MEFSKGVLYLCATPIGNLEDMTYRAVRVLSEVNAIAAEDTRHTRKLLTHFAIHTPLISYHEHNKKERGPELMDRLLHGESLAVVSDAGMPGISDPGTDLVKLAIAAGIQVVPVPGCNAALSALVSSGLDTELFMFIGFLPKTKKKRQELLLSLAEYRHTLLFYETPHRLRETLAELKDAFGDRKVAAARELTKKFEEFIRGSFSDLIAHFAVHVPRGEFTLVVSGRDDCAAESVPEEWTQSDIVKAVANLVAAGSNKKDAIKSVASRCKLAKREVYQAVITAEKQKKNRG